jgi:hypothetical protein
MGEFRIGNIHAISLNSVSLMIICVLKAVLKDKDVILLHSSMSEKNWCRYHKVLLNDFEYMKISEVEVILLLHDYEGGGNVFF